MPATRQTVTEIIAALMWQPQTSEQLQEATGASRQTVDGWIRELRASGVVRVHSYERRSGGPLRLYGMQTQPFGEPDAPRPTNPNHRKVLA